MNEFQLRRLFYDDEVSLGVCLITGGRHTKVLDPWFAAKHIHVVMTQVKGVAEGNDDEEEETVVEYLMDYQGYRQVENHLVDLKRDHRLKFVPLPGPLLSMLKLASENPYPKKPTEQHQLKTLVDESLYSQLKPYQIDAVEFFLIRGGRGILGDEMGLGKSCQAITLSLALKTKAKSTASTESSPSTVRPTATAVRPTACLIICPATLRDNWIDKELKRWAPHVPEERIMKLMKREELSRIFAHRETKDDSGSHTTSDPTETKKRKLQEPQEPQEGKEHSESKELVQGQHEPPTKKRKTSLSKQKAITTSTKPKPTRKRKVTTPTPDDLKSIDYFVLSYEFLVNDNAFDLVKRHILPLVHFAILDESQKVKTQAAKRSQRACEVCNTVEHALLLSGTQAVSSKECFNQLQCIQSGLFPTLWVTPKRLPKHLKTKYQLRPVRHEYFPYSFAMRWCDPYLKQTYGPNYEWDFSGSYRTKELHEVQKYWMMLRRTKAETLGDVLPPKTRERVMITISDEELEKMNQQLEEMSKLEGQPELKKKLYSGVYNDLTRVKLPLIKEYVRSTILHKQTGWFRHIPAHQVPSFSSTKQKTDSSAMDARSTGSRKVLLFAYHKEMIQTLLTVLCDAGLKVDKDFILINGDTAQQKRQKMVDRFQTDPVCKLAILSMGAAGTGLQFSKATDVVFTEMYWTPDLHLQSESRAHRLGCERPVRVLYLLAKGSIDEHIWRLIGKKEQIGGELCDGQGRRFVSDKTTHLDLKLEGLDLMLPELDGIS